MHYLFADCVLDTQCYLLRRAGQSIRLRPKVFQVLTYLLIHRDRVIPKHELCEQVWSAPAVSDATIDNCLKAVRHAIGDTGQAQRFIETRYGHGYRFVAPVTMSPDGGAPEVSAAVSLLPVRATAASHDAPVALEAECPPQSPVPLSMDDALPVGEWKVVTILCCALVAPAVHGEQRCLETWQRRLHTLHELACHEAQRYGGLVRAKWGECPDRLWRARGAGGSARAARGVDGLEHAATTGRRAGDPCEPRRGSSSGPHEPPYRTAAVGESAASMRRAPWSLARL